MDPALKYGLLLPFTILVAVICIVGGTRGWKWLVDPPEDLALIYSQSLIKSIYGGAFLRRFTIFAGYFFLVLSIVICLS